MSGGWRAAGTSFPLQVTSFKGCVPVGGQGTWTSAGVHCKGYAGCELRRGCGGGGGEGKVCERSTLVEKC